MRPWRLGASQDMPVKKICFWAINIWYQEKYCYNNVFDWFLEPTSQPCGVNHEPRRSSHERTWWVGQYLALFVSGFGGNQRHQPHILLTNRPSKSIKNGLKLHLQFITPNATINFAIATGRLEDRSNEYDEKTKDERSMVEEEEDT